MTSVVIAAHNEALAHGFAYVTFNNSDCGEDTTLRLAELFVERKDTLAAIINREMGKPLPQARVRAPTAGR